MASDRRLKLGAFMRPVSIHTGAWRYPDANFNFAHWAVLRHLLAKVPWAARPSLEGRRRLDGGRRRHNGL